MMVRFQRRNFLKLTLCSSLGIVGSNSIDTAQAAESVSFSGKVVTADGEPAGDVSMEADTNAWPRTITDSRGEFSLTVSANTGFNLGLYESKIDSTPPKYDDIPFIFDFGNYTVADEDIDVGTLTLPEVHRVELQVLDKEGEPAPSAAPYVAAKREGHGYGTGQSEIYLNHNGFLQLDGAKQTGAEFGGPILLSVEFRESGATFRKTLSITEPTALIVQDGQGFREADTPMATTTQATTTTPPTTSTKTATSTRATEELQTTASTTSQARMEPVKTTNTTGAKSRRGFFSNSEGPGEYEFLTNPVFLTVGGFVLSVAGIAQNLIRGR